MHSPPSILIADDDDGHAFLIEDQLRHAGIDVPFLRFTDGQEVLDFLFHRMAEPAFQPQQHYILLLDIRMPKVDGVTVLREIKTDQNLRKLPVIMLTTTDNPQEVDRCHQLGCNAYLCKPITYDRFVQAVQSLGGFIGQIETPVAS